MSRYPKKNSQRLNYDFVKKFFENNDCKLLSTEYKNARTHLEYICKCGNKSKITFDSFRRGHRCKKCATIRVKNNKALSYEYVKRFIESKGCILLSEKYKNSAHKLKIKCRCGMIFYRRFGNFKTKQQYICFECSIKNRSGKNHYEWKKNREELKLYNDIRQKSYKMIRYILKKTNKSKIDRTHNILGYKTSDLIKHIKDHSNWKNIDKNNWHLDHVFPIQAFLDHDVTDLKIINCLENLQPLNAKDNIIKSNKYDLKSFRKWLKTKEK